MVEQYFKFDYTPFERNIASQFLFESSQFSEGLARLVYTCERRNMSVLTGDVGCGKSTLLRMLQSKLDQHQYLFIYIADSQLTPRNFYTLVLKEIGLEPPTQLTKLKHTFKAVVTDFFESKKRTIIIAIDEAQALELSMVQELRFVMNFEFDSTSPMGLILSGQPEFRATLRTPFMSSIWRRVETHYHLTGMSEEETDKYISHHVKAAGCNHPLFPTEVMTRIHENSKGIPAMVNILCKGCLLDAAMRNQQLVDSENLERVLTERT